MAARDDAAVPAPGEGPELPEGRRFLAEGLASGDRGKCCVWGEPILLALGGDWKLEVEFGTAGD